MEKLILRLLHFLIYAVLFIHKFIMVSIQFDSYLFVQFKYNHIMSTLRYYALMVYFRCDEDAIVKECCSHERMKDSKKLTHAAIVVNHLKEDQMVSLVSN